MSNLYENRKSQYCYENSNVLINKLNLKDPKKLRYYEAKITAAKLLGLRKMGVTGNFNIEHLKNIHKYLFEDIYPFAGEFRKENISKDEFRFAEWEYIENELKILLDKLKKEKYLQNYDKKELAKRLAYYLAEINVLHPFREGNGRTSREFIRQLALLNGYRLNLKEVPTKEILEAMKLSIVYTEKLEDILYKCLEKGDEKKDY